MLFEEIKREEFNAGREEGFSEGKIEGMIEALRYILSIKFIISDEVMKKIETISDMDTADCLLKAAYSAGSVSEFESELNKYL